MRARWKRAEIIDKRIAQDLDILLPVPMKIARFYVRHVYLYDASALFAVHEKKALYVGNVQ